MLNHLAMIDGWAHFTSFKDRKLRKAYRVDLRNAGPGIPVGETE